MFIEIDNENIAVKGHVASLGFIIKWQIKKIKCRRSPPKSIVTKTEAFYISNSPQFLGDINPSVLPILDRLVAHKGGSLRMLDLVFKRLHLCCLIYT